VTVPLLALSLLVACRGTSGSDGDGDAVVDGPDTVDTSTVVDTTPTATVDTTPTGTTDSVPLDGWVAEAPLQALRERLAAEGWTLQEGVPRAVNLDDCCLFESCHSRNPTAHYVMLDLPLAEGEAERVVDDAITYRTTADEAVVFVGRMPPPARYSSFRTYVHRRYSPTTGQPEPSYLNLGDSLNQVVLRHWGDSPTAPFGATTVVISTADAGIERTVRGFFEDAGFPADVLNTDWIPTARVQFGLDETGDLLRMNLRVSKFDDPVAGEAWLEEPQGVVLRMRPPVPPTPEPIIEPTPRPAGGLTTELPLQPAVDELREAVLERWGDYPILDADASSNQPPHDEPCWPGCNRDSTYGGAPALVMPLEDTIDVIVFGVNHAASGMVSYANAFVLGTSNEDPAAFVDTTMMPGSADDYLPGHPDVDKLYVWRFSRSCGSDPYCSEVVQGCPGLEADERPLLGWRTYLDPATGTHAELSHMIQDDAIFIYKGKVPESTP